MWWSEAWLFIYLMKVKGKTGYRERGEGEKEEEEGDEDDDSDDVWSNSGEDQMEREMERRMVKKEFPGIVKASKVLF